MSDYFFKTKPYDHQLEAFNKSCDKIDYALLMDMGTGKTKVSIDTIGYAYKKGVTNLALIVAPKGVIANWIGEIETHLPEDLERAVCLWKPGLTKKFREELTALSETKFKG